MAVPAEGSVLDLGCGAGLFARMLAIQQPRLSVLGIDPDPAKIALAKKGRCLENLRFELRDPAWPRPGEVFKCITLVDVLYLLPPEEQRALIARAAACLAPGGLLLIKSMDTRKRLRIAWDRLQESVSIRITKMTRGTGIHHVPPESVRSWMESDACLETGEQPVDAGYVHPHLLLTGRRRLSDAR